MGQEQRRLAAILAADVAGYSRLMAADESGTLARFRQLRTGVIDPAIAQFQGRVVGTAGDSLLVEFNNALAAVECAVACQRALSGINAPEAEDRRIIFRMGINLGDVIAADDTIHGDGVNVASRIEKLAEPGGLCIARNVYDQVENKVDLSFTDLGEHQVKNIAKPIRVYRAEFADQPKPAAVTGAGAVDSHPSGRVSIAVLPFDNMSGDPEQGYFSDGVTEDIITELSRFRELLVTARNSSFQFRGKTIDVKEIAQKLGAEFVVEGSVRKIGNRVRVTAQLIEAAAGNHIWAERYDRDLEDIFVVQDELVRAISGAIPGQINRFAVESTRRKAPGNLTAYDCELRGRWAYVHWNEGLSAAQDWFEKAIAADPDYALAHSGLAMTYATGLYVLGLPPETTLARAKEHARLATTLDDRNPVIQASAAIAYMLCAEHNLMRTHADRAILLNPNDPFTLTVKAHVLTYEGDLARALEFFTKSERLEPYTPDDSRLDCLFDCYYMRGEYAKAVDVFRRYVNFPTFLYLPLAAAYAQAGEFEKAKAAVMDFHRLRAPEYDLKTMIKYHVRMCVRQADRDHWLEGYRKAGLDV